jgi:UDP-N-acetyl-D-glucosamine dehydrogenase
MFRGVAMRRLVVVGQGYVGLPLALRAAQKGFSVTGLDIKPAIVEALNAGWSHIDDICNDEVKSALAAGYRASTDSSCIAQADVVVVCVPTPLSADGGPDLGAVEGAAATIASQVRPNTLVILESTSYPGTTQDIFAPLVLKSGLELGKDINIAFSPERIDPGNPHYGISNTPKLVGGLTPECTMAAHDFYAEFIDTVVAAKGAKEAEMAKLIENTFRHVNIALVNEMVRFCDEMQIDLWDAIDCAATKPFGFMAFRPGPGVGGHCIPVDPSYLSHQVRAQLGYSFRMVELAEEINAAAPLYVATRLWKALNERKITVNGAKVLLVGVTYKPNISDCRQSPANPLARRLAAWGAQISYHDPFVPQWDLQTDDGPAVLRTVGDVYAAAAEADIVVLLQPHSAYDLDALAQASSLLLDTRGSLESSETVHRL